MIRFENDILYPRDVPLRILSNNLASAEGRGRFAGEVIEVLDSGSLLFSGVHLDRIAD